MTVICSIDSSLHLLIFLEVRPCKQDFTVQWIQLLSDTNEFGTCFLRNYETGIPVIMWHIFMDEVCFILFSMSQCRSGKSDFHWAFLYTAIELSSMLLASTAACCCFTISKWIKCCSHSLKTYLALMHNLFPALSSFPTKRKSAFKECRGLEI